MSTWMSDYLDAWNSHNGEKVASFMADDVVYEDLTVGQIHEGLTPSLPSSRGATTSPRTTSSFR